MNEFRRERGPDLGVLDPAARDPGYWQRFETRVLTAALPALGRRRRAHTTLPDVVNAWSRLLVPAAAAAALAGVALLTVSAEDAVVVAEDVVLPGEEGYGTMPAFLASEETVDRDVVFFALDGP